MNIGKITVSQLQLEINIPYISIQDIDIHYMENEHGQLRICLEIYDTVTLGQTAALIGTSIKVMMPEGKVLFNGQCTNTAYQEQARYKQVIIEAKTSSIQTDQQINTQTFQSPSKKQGDVIGEVLAKYGALHQMNQNPAIGTVIYQQQETDWTFITRIANQYGQQVYVNGRSSHTDIKIGTGLMQTFSTDVLEEKLSSEKNIGELRQVMMNGDDSAASYQFCIDEYRCSELSVIPGDQIGRDTVRESRVWNHGGILVNTIKIGKTNDVRPA